VTRVDRRTFLKHLGVVSAATAAAAAATPMTLSGMDTLTGDARLPTWKKAPCRLCGVGCGLLIGIENGKAVAVRGDPDSPVSQGLACAKGYYSVRALYGADRLTRATVRRGGARAEVPMRDALDLVARTLRETIDRHGKDSVAMYGSAQWSITDAYVAGKLFKGALGTNNVETSARLHSGSAMAGQRSTFGLDGAVGSYADIEHADVFVLWDVNLAETDPVLFSRMLERRRRDPAVRIVELATRRSRTSYAADHSLLHAAHTAPAIANAISREIVTRNWVNREFVDRYVAFRAGGTSPGYGLTTDALVADHVSEASWHDYVGSLAAYEPERAETLSGLSAASIRFVASLYGDPQRKVMSVWGHEVNRDARGTWLNNLVTNIHLLVGKVASPGNGPFATTGQPSGGCAVHDAGSLSETLPAGRVDNEVDRRRAAGIWNVPSDRIDPKPGAHALSLFRRIERGELRFLWIMATDPMVSMPNVDRYRRAAARGGCFLVVSEAYPTPTTDLADVVLPSAMWLERGGVYGNAERRLQHFERMVEPPGEAMADAWQMIEVAHRLGFNDLFDYAPNRYVDQIWEEYGRFHTDAATALPTLTTLRAVTGAQWPFANGSGTQWRYNTSLDAAADKKRGAFDFYGHADHRAWVWLRPAEPPAEATDRSYPLWLTTGAVLEQWGTGTMTQRIPTLHRAVPHSYLELNRDDAADLGIANREMVRVVSRRGAVELEARIDYRSQPLRGHAFAPWFDERRPVNRLTLDAFCPLSGQPDGGACAVRVERLTPRGGP
jgi:nitrate reductase (cytochrome)